VPGTDLQRVINTNVLIVRDTSGAHYLKILDGWMESYSLLDGWWTVSGVPPDGGQVALREAIASKNVDLLQEGDFARDGSGPGLANQSPEVYVSTVPASLIVIEGEPRFAGIPGTALEYMENSSSPVFREPTDQELYLFVSGRWFRSWRTEGPWQPVAATQLPADFKKIPDSLLKSSGGSK
jgi:hypothetical protein